MSDMTSSVPLCPAIFERSKPCIDIFFRWISGGRFDPCLLRQSRTGFGTVKRRQAWIWLLPRCEQRSRLQDQQPSRVSTGGGGSSWVSGDWSVSCTAAATPGARVGWSGGCFPGPGCVVAIPGRTEAAPGGTGPGPANSPDQTRGYAGSSLLLWSASGLCRSGVGSHQQSWPTLRYTTS